MRNEVRRSQFHVFQVFISFIYCQLIDPVQYLLKGLRLDLGNVILKHLKAIRFPHAKPDKGCTDPGVCLGISQFPVILAFYLLVDRCPNDLFNRGYINPAKPTVLAVSPDIILHQ